jgi:hypothetical protein
MLRDRTNHAYLHSTRGTAYDNGLTCTFTTSTFSGSTGRLWDEDIQIDISGANSVRLWYRSGSVMTFEDNVARAYKISGTTPQFDSSGTLTNVTNGNYWSSWIYGTNEATYPYAAVVGQFQWTTLAAAQAGSQPTFPNMTTREWKLIYRVIWRFQGGNVSVQQTEDYRTVSNIPGAAAPTTLPASQVTYVPTSPLTLTTVQGALDQVAGLLVSTTDILLTADPYSAVDYSATYSGDTITTESWTRTGGNLLKNITYAYSGSSLSTGTITVYDIDGSTPLGQVVRTFTYSGGKLASMSQSRPV